MLELLADGDGDGDCDDDGDCNGDSNGDSDGDSDDEGDGDGDDDGEGVFSTSAYELSGVWGASSMVTISLKDSAVAMLSPSALSTPSFLLCPFSTCLFDKDEFVRVGFLTLFAIVFLFKNR